MNKPFNPQSGHHYKDNHGALITIKRVDHNRVTFYRDGYQSPYVQPLDRFVKEFSEVAL